MDNSLLDAGVHQHDVKIFIQFLADGVCDLSMHFHESGDSVHRPAPPAALRGDPESPLIMTAEGLQALQGSRYAVREMNEADIEFGGTDRQVAQRFEIGIIAAISRRPHVHIIET